MAHQHSMNSNSSPEQQENVSEYCR